MSKYVKVDDVMALINTSNRGNCDYFIVDKIEELCNSNNVYGVDKVVVDEAIEKIKYIMNEKHYSNAEECDYGNFYKCENALMIADIENVLSELDN